MVAPARMRSDASGVGASEIGVAARVREHLPASGTFFEELDEFRGWIHAICDRYSTAAAIGHGFFRSRCERRSSAPQTAGTADQGSTGAGLHPRQWPGCRRTIEMSARRDATSAAVWRLTLWPQAIMQVSCADHALDSAPGISASEWIRRLWRWAILPFATNAFQADQLIMVESRIRWLRAGRQ